MFIPYNFLYQKTIFKPLKDFFYKKKIEQNCAYIEKTRKFIKFALMSLATIVLIEAVQIFSMLGSFDIEDILLNMLGASIGFYCWNVLLGKK